MVPFGATCGGQAAPEGEGGLLAIVAYPSAIVPIVVIVWRGIFVPYHFFANAAFYETPNFVGRFVPAGWRGAVVSHRFLFRLNLLAVLVMRWAIA